MVCIPGARVWITGLRARPDLNEQEAVVLSEQKERWAVRCTLSDECVKVKPANLVFCEGRLAVLEEDLLLTMDTCTISSSESSEILWATLPVVKAGAAMGGVREE